MMVYLPWTCQFGVKKNTNSQPCDLVITLNVSHIFFADLPNDTGYPYPIQILAFLVIWPNSILIRILAKFMEKLFLTALCHCMHYNKAVTTRT